MSLPVNYEVRDIIWCYLLTMKKLETLQGAIVGIKNI